MPWMICGIFCNCWRDDLVVKRRSDLQIRCKSDFCTDFTTRHPLEGHVLVVKRRSDLQIRCRSNCLHRFYNGIPPWRACFRCKNVVRICKSVVNRIVCTDFTTSYSFEGRNLVVKCRSDFQIRYQLDLNLELPGFRNSYSLPHECVLLKTRYRMDYFMNSVTRPIRFKETHSSQFGKQFKYLNNSRFLYHLQFIPHIHSRHVCRMWADV